MKTYGELIREIVADGGEVTFKPSAAQNAINIHIRRAEKRIDWSVSQIELDQCVLDALELALGTAYGCLVDSTFNMGSSLEHIKPRL